MISTVSATWRGVSRPGRGDHDDLGVQTLCHLGVEAGTVRLLLSIHQTFDDDCAGVVSRLLKTADDLFQQHVFPVMTEQVFRFADRDRFGRIQTGHHARQSGRAFWTGIAGVRLADGFAKTYRNAFAVERVNEA
jgi:hypothetical protein